MDVQPPQTQSHLIKRYNLTFLEDYRLILSKLDKVKYISLRNYFRRVFNSGSVQSAINKAGIKQSQVQVMKRSFLNDFDVKVEKKTSTMIILMFLKFMKNNFDALIINEKQIMELRDLQEKEGKSILLLPSFKSMVDFIIVSYITIFYELSSPIINSPRNPQITFFKHFATKAGGFFIDPEKYPSKIY